MNEDRDTLPDLMSDEDNEPTLRMFRPYTQKESIMVASITLCGWLAVIWWLLR